MTEKEKILLSGLATKVKPVTDEEVQALRRLFKKKLRTNNKTQTEWCRENGVKDSALSNAIHRNVTSHRILSLVARYVMDENWR